MVRKNFGFIFLLGIFVFALGFVSADSFISGIIYNTSIGGEVVEGADVEVICNGIPMSDVSESDGSYGVSFPSDECNSSHVYSVSAEKDDYSGESGEHSDINDLFGAVMNLAVEKEDVEESISISGIIYNTTLGGEVVEGADVEVICNGIPVSAISNGDGSYGVSFLKSECNSSHVYSVSAEKGNYSGESGEHNDINDLFGAVMNLAIEEESSEDAVIVFIGTIYNTTIGGAFVSGADVSLTCGIVKSGLSDVNGSYRFEFLESECNGSLVYVVDAVSGEYSGTSGDLSFVVDSDNVYDLVISKAAEEEEEENSGGSKKSGSSGGRVTMCADGFHFLKEGSSVCVPDVVEELNVSLEELNVSEDSGVEDEGEEDKGFFAGVLSFITGAVIGGVMGSWIAVVLFILVVIGLFLFAWSKKK
ncbi:hypothetical protein K8R30_00565 [archaeon]|nr:hypothetical protein [archaeon]